MDEKDLKLRRRRRYKNQRYEHILEETERNGYAAHTRGWPNALLTKPGEPVRALFIGSDIKGHYPKEPLIGFNRNQKMMMMLFEKMGAKVLKVKP